MPLFSIKMRPGLDSVKTPTLNEGGWSSAENVRFFNGLPQKDSGFVNFATVTDTPRSMRAWRALSGLYYLGVGGSQFISVFSGSTVSDITPLTIADFIALSITVSSGSSTITVNDTVNTPSVGQAVNIVAPISVGGIILLGTYIITAVNSGVSWQFSAAQQATSNVTAGGTVRIFTVTAGSNIVDVTLPNHGLVTGQMTTLPVNDHLGGINIGGNYIVTVVNANQYLITASSPATSSQTAAESNGQLDLIFFNPASGGSANAIPASVTSTDNWGEFLLECSQGGPVNVWQPATGTSTRASVVATAPLSNNFIFVAIQQQQLVCCGTINATTNIFDPMLLAWSTTGDYTNFVPTAGNLAGSFRLPIGSQITAGIAFIGQNLIWTDIALYSMQFLGSPLVWGFQPLGINCGAVGPHSVGVLAGVPYWMSQNQFFMLGSGGPQMIECPVWDQVFQGVDRANIQTVTCETDSYYGEVAWSVPQANGTYIFVRLRPDPVYGPAWTASTYHHHTAWLDQNVFGSALGGHESGLIDQHDNGVDAAGAALPTQLTSGMILISEGSQTTFVRDFLPDFDWLGTTGSLSLSIAFYSYPESTPRISGPFTITPSTQVIHPRGRARAIQMLISGNDLGSNWRFGNVRYRAHPDGSR